MTGKKDMVKGVHIERTHCPNCGETLICNVPQDLERGVFGEKYCPDCLCHWTYDYFKFLPDDIPGEEEEPECT